MRYLTIGNVVGLEAEDQERLNELVGIYNYHLMQNEKKNRYYEGHIPLRDVNLGIALPKNFNELEIGCAWGEKCVDVLAGHSMFDGFVAEDETVAQTVNSIVQRNRLISGYQKTCKDQLKFGCTFATLSADERAKARIRFHTPMTAAAAWDGEKDRIGYGLAIIDSARDEKDKNIWKPSLINLYTDEAIIVLQLTEGIWKADYKHHNMGRPLMEPFIWNPTSDKPFGRSRIKEPIRRLIESYVRTIANATIGLEFATAPQKYLLGVTDEQYDALINEKFRQYVGNVLLGTTNTETGEKPTFGQLPQGNIQPHVEMLRIISTQFSAASGLTVTDTGVINNANPTSSEAIIAQSQTLIRMAETLNQINGEALGNIMIMAMAIEKRTSIDRITDEEKNIMAHFKNPAMPSVAVTTDAAIKIASSREDFASTDVFLEMVGFTQADIRRIKTQEQRSRGARLLAEELADEDID